MIGSGLVEKIRRWTVVVGSVLSASIFWGLLAAGVAKYIFGIVSEQTLLYFGLPVSIIMGVYLVPKMRKFVGI